MSTSSRDKPAVQRTDAQAAAEIRRVAGTMTISDIMDRLHMGATRFWRIVEAEKIDVAFQPAPRDFRRAMDDKQRRGASGADRQWRDFMLFGKPRKYTAWSQPVSIAYSTGIKGAGARL